MRCYDLLSLHPLNWCLPPSLCCFLRCFFAVPTAAISASQAATKRGCVQSPHQRWRSPKLQSLDRKDSQNDEEQKGEQHAFEKIIEFRLSSKSSNFNSKWNLNEISYWFIILCFSKISKINELSCSKAHRLISEIWGHAIAVARTTSKIRNQGGAHATEFTNAEALWFNHCDGVWSAKVSEDPSYATQKSTRNISYSRFEKSCSCRYL